MIMMMHRISRSGMREITANWRSKFNGWRVIDSAWIVIGGYGITGAIAGGVAAGAALLFAAPAIAFAGVTLS